MHRFFLCLFLGALVCLHTACGGTGRAVKTVAFASDVNPALAAGSGLNAGGALIMDEYRIGIGDVLMISVWKDEALTRQVSVLPDGMISFPLIGQLRAVGMSLADLKADITKRLDKYVPGVTLTVQVLQVFSQVVYVIGKVNRPGRFELHDNINVLQALALAGGLNPFAKSKHIKVFRGAERRTRIFPFNYDEVARGDHLEQNIQLNRSDVVVVP